MDNSSQKDNRILDRHNYDNKTIAVFELVSAYFTDIFYNHLYDQAKNMKASGSSPSITHGYKHALQAWIQGLDKPYFHSKTIKGIHDWMLNYTKFTTISYNACIDKITSEFIPNDYFSSLTNTQKVGVLKKIINNANKAIIQKIVNEYLGLIIDNRNPDNATIIKDAMVDTLIWEKETMYRKFVESQTKPVGGLDFNMRDKVEAEIKQILKEKYELKILVENLKKIIIKNNDTISSLRETVGELQTALAEAQSPISAPIQLNSKEKNDEISMLERNILSDSSPYMNSTSNQEPSISKEEPSNEIRPDNSANQISNQTPSQTPEQATKEPVEKEPVEKEPVEKEPVEKEPVKKSRAKSTKPRAKAAAKPRSKKSASASTESKDSPPKENEDAKEDSHDPELRPIIDMGKFIDLDLYR